MEALLLREPPTQCTSVHDHVQIQVQRDVCLMAEVTATSTDVQL